LSSRMSFSEMLSRCFISARRVLPCAAMITCRPFCSNQPQNSPKLDQRSRSKSETCGTVLERLRSQTDQSNLVKFYCGPGTGAKCCDQHHGCRKNLSAGVRHITKTKRHVFTQIFDSCYRLPWLGPPVNALQYVVYFRFCR